MTSLALEVTTAGFDSHDDLTNRIGDHLNMAITPDGTAPTGLLQIAVVGSTCGLTIMRYEPGSVADLLTLLDKLAPTGTPYEHERTTGDPNGASHLRSNILGTSVCVPIRNGEIAMAKTHSIVLFDFDLKPATRHVWLELPCSHDAPQRQQEQLEP